MHKEILLQIIHLAMAAVLKLRQINDINPIDIELC